MSEGAVAESAVVPASILHSVDCEIRTDTLTRQLYSTDASIYRIEPSGVAFPKTSKQASQVIQTAADAGMSVIPRGAGTGLAGGAIGKGLVVDFARHNRKIWGLNVDARTVNVGAGVVLDQLNDFLKPHKLCFGPDVATSARATLGGMIANNSSGSRVPVYGTTSDHVLSLEVVFADGRIERVGGKKESIMELSDALRERITPHAPAIREILHDGIKKRWHGYGFDRYLRADCDVVKLLSGSEGTLAGIFSAELNLCPMPKQKGLAVFFFASIAEAMQATMDLLELSPAAIEHIDDTLFNQTRGQLAFAAARDLLHLDDLPCKSILIVEFYDDIDDRLAIAEEKKLGLRNLILRGEREMNQVWALRKAGLSLLTGCKGSAKPTAGIEDSAVRPRDLPEYVAAVQELIEKGTGKEGSFYGHAAAGLLHIRPVIDLHNADDVARYRQLAADVSALVKHFRGSVSAEHGVGIGHTEFLPDHLGPELMALTRDVKQIFDPRNCLNPGKITPGPEDYRIETNLRLGPNYELKLPFEPVLAFAAKDESFVANLEQCNGCGGCRKLAPTMCPTFLATGDELMSTRGRANTIRAALELRLDDASDPLCSDALEAALSSCLSCKACTAECPSNVNMALLKAELVHARQRKYGAPLSAHILSNVELLGRLGCFIPRITNAALQSSMIRSVMERVLGVSSKRPLPLYTHTRFDVWFNQRQTKISGKRGRVLLWDDTFVRYNEPHVGQAAVHVLEAAGYEVVLAHGRKCCGRPAFSLGRLDMARGYGRHNLELLANQDPDTPILFLEPSCYSMFVEDYRELGLPNAASVAKRCMLFEDFVESLLERDPEALRFQDGYSWVAIHGHCHAKALVDTGAMTRLARRLPNSSVTMLNTGCCGMAGAFGAMSKTYDLSLQVAKPLAQQIQELTAGTQVVASGTSCRHQIDHVTDCRPMHMAELLAQSLRRG